MTEQSQARPAPQCCLDHIEAAKAGHVECLRRLQETGRFLGLHDPERESAGEATKLEVWDAAVAACKAGRAQVLSWLFSGGWPDTVDAAVPWYSADLAQPREEGDWEKVDLRDMPHREESFLPEVKLCRYAMRNSDAACLEALLNAGCRSEWLCPLAALEGREGHLALAAERGARCDARTMYPAASKGNVRLLQTAHHHATIQAGGLSGSSLLDWCGSDTLRHCVEAAAQSGHVDCLGALLTWFRDDGIWFYASNAAASGGHISCLEELQRRGWEDWTVAASNAAKAGQVECLLYLLELPPLRHLLDRYPAIGSACLMESAAQGGHLACLKLLHERGFACGRSEVKAATTSGNCECLQYVLDHTQGHPELELEAICMCKYSKSCLQVLFDRGCLARSRQLWDLRPKFMEQFLARVDLQCLKVIVANAGRPPTDMLYTWAVTWRGVAFLQYVHELGAPWHPTTMSAASGSVDMVRYAHENGCPWGEAVLSDFIGDVECLRYAHENGCAYDVPARSTTLPDFQALQYAWKHMDRGWDREVVGNAVKCNFTTQEGLASLGVGIAYVLEASRRFAASEYDWRVLLYLVKEMKMGRAELGVLAQLADVRLSRAAALAQCFYVAGKYTRQLGGWADVWPAMARCPYEVREKIASDAHLALPPL